MNIEIVPVIRKSNAEFELKVDGRPVGTLEKEDGKWCARLLLKDPRFLAGVYTAIFGFGATEHGAIVAAFEEGRKHRDALTERLAELEATVGETIRQVQFS